MMGARAYARRMLAAGRLQLGTGLQRMLCSRGWVEVVLHREGAFQTQLSIILPGAIVPVHRHLLCDSYDVAVAGSGELSLWPLLLNVPLAPRLLHVPRGAWHGGRAGDQGAAYLSFQHWQGGEPDFISTDWEARQ